ncbi:hypothetical protein BKA62DRAFT_357140 [Auriculariales sp. MPI-PUGE-AT-0066]|nr:hypothetical protein BKA62DRAFT_357140 [Auriculariales sp. MPI-PUGE-AT-0066]
MSNNTERRALKRAWNPPSRPSERRIRTSPSLPLAELLRDGRPVFECAGCGFTHDRGIPICLWCLWTSQEAAEASASARPRQRTLSAPSTVCVGALLKAAPETTVAIVSTEPNQDTPPHDSYNAPNESHRPPSQLQEYMQHLPSDLESSMHRPSFTSSSFNSSLATSSYAATLSTPSTSYLPPSSRPSSPEPPNGAHSQQKYGAYVARKSAQRQSFLARISEQASAHAVAVPHSQTSPVEAPQPGAIALGLLLPIYGALDLAPNHEVRHASMSSQKRLSVGSRRTSGVPSLVSAGSRLSSDRPSMDSSRRVRFSAELPVPRGKGEVAILPTVHEQKPRNRLSRAIKRVSNVFRLGSARQ